MHKYKLLGFEQSHLLRVFVYLFKLTSILIGFVTCQVWEQ